MLYPRAFVALIGYLALVVLPSATPFNVPASSVPSGRHTAALCAERFRRSSTYGLAGLKMRSSGRGERRTENIEGNFFVDKTCINCYTCRWIAPETFTLENGQSAVTSQPQNSEDVTNALRAMTSCPTGSIRAEKTPKEVKDVISSFPVPVEGVENVFHSGFHSERSFGATSYFLKGESGNILIDSPRFFGPLAKRIHELGGVEWMWLSHIDDVADHEKWKTEFPNLKRIIHESEVRGKGLEQCEMILEGEGPWTIDGVGEVILQSGHTKGHLVLLREQVL